MNGSLGSLAAGGEPVRGQFRAQRDHCRSRRQRVQHGGEQRRRDNFGLAADFWAAMAARVAIDPVNNANWYVNAEEGVGSLPLFRTARRAVSSVWNQSRRHGCGCRRRWADHDHAGAVPGRSTGLDQVLIGTCRVWRGPANGSGWSESNAIQPHSRYRGNQRLLQWRCVDSFDGRIVSRSGAKCGQRVACSARRKERRSARARSVRDVQSGQRRSARHGRTLALKPGEQ